MRGETAKRVKEAFEEMKKEADNEFLVQSEVLKEDDRY